MQFLFAILSLVASFAIQALMGPAQKKPPSQVLSDFKFPQSAEGKEQAVIFGDTWTPDYQILWYGNYRQAPIYAEGAKKG